MKQAREEAKAYTDARGDLKKLRAYVTSCAICESRAAANAEIISIARQKCDRTLGTQFDSDVPKSTPFMRDTAALSDDEIQQRLSACLTMQKYSDERRYQTQAGRAYATQASRAAVANDTATARVKMSKAIKQWQDAMAAGSGTAMNFLGAYENGTYNTAAVSFVTPNFQTALDYWLKGAEANNVKAMENAGIVLLAGSTEYPPVQRDVDKAQTLLVKAIQGGDQVAATVLGRALFYGSPQEIKRDVGRGLNYLVKACVAGETGAKRFFDIEMNRQQHRTLLPATRPAGCSSDTLQVANVTQNVLQPRAGTPTYWDYNGSIFELIADGPSRKFYYFSPREGLDAVGVTRGTLFLESKRTQDKYIGNAYTFSKYCGSIAYPVAGTVSSDQRSVHLSGNQPKRNANCDIVSFSNESIEFNLRTSESGGHYLGNEVR